MRQHQPQQTQQNKQAAAHATPKGSTGETVRLKVGEKDDLFKRQTDQVLKRVEKGGLGKSIKIKPLAIIRGGKKSAQSTPTAPVTVEAPAVKSGAPAAKAGPTALLMPPPPDALSPAAQKRLDTVQQKTAVVARQQAAMPDATSNVSEARGAVKEPQQETQARAGGAVVAGFAEKQPPSPEVEKLCKDIREAIKKQRPPDEESLVNANPTVAAQQAGAQLDSSIQNNAQQAQGGYDAMQSTPQGAPQLQPQAMDAPPVAVQSASPGATSAVPDAVPANNVSLDADIAANEKRMQDAGMNNEPAKLVQDGPIAEARAAKGELSETAKQDPAKVMSEQKAVLDKAVADMQALQVAAMESLKSSRAGSVTGVTQRQHKMVESEEQTRTRVGKEAQAIFEEAQKKVDDLLKPLPETGMKKWEAGIKIASEKFKNRLKKVENWINDRHSGVGGFFVGLGDAVFGLPAWVTTEYNAAEQQFGDEACNLIREISSDVNTVIASCESIIAEARKQIDKLFSDLPDNLKAWAAGEQARFGSQLDQLNKQVGDTRKNFTKDLVNRAASTVQEVREKIHALREKAKGLVGRIASAIGRFLDDPIRFIINGLLSLVGISPATFWALIAKIKKVIKDMADDPKKFANNLMTAIGKGFNQFFDNIKTHLLTGLMDWLTSGLKTAGVSLPKDFSIKSIITFFLELMGISWERIRKLIAKRIGEKNMALIEKAYSIIAKLIQMGPAGIFELLKDKLDPQQILKKVMDAAISFMIEAIIKKVTLRIIAMFNPVGAIIQAIEAIYRVIKWIFDNAARIFTLVESVVDGIGNIIAGNIGGMANIVEKALVKIIAPVIDFLAGFLGFGDLPDKIAKVIIGFQSWVEGILDTVIGWLAEQAKKLFGSIKEAVSSFFSPKSFKVENEDHRLYSDDNGNPMVASYSPKRLEEALKELKGDITLAKKLERINKRLKKEKDPTQRASLQKDIDKLTSRIVDLLVKLKYGEGTKETMPLATISFAISGNAVEFRRQIAMQETALNSMKIGDWQRNRARFIGFGRESRSVDSDVKRAEAFSNAIIANVNTITGLTSRDKKSLLEYANSEGRITKQEGKKLALSIAERLIASRSTRGKAVLHTIDQVAGGSATVYGDETGVLGSSAVNSSIGSQWKDKKVAEVDSKAAGVKPTANIYVKLNT